MGVPYDDARYSGLGPRNGKNVQPETSGEAATVPRKGKRLWLHATRNKCGRAIELESKPYAATGTRPYLILWLCPPPRSSVAHGNGTVQYVKTTEGRQTPTQPSRWGQTPSRSLATVIDT
ncbi:hypothetical protein CTA1_8609 [Colletotrichum tanaceti]|uniref:Uncharacterized protein n=1 Tax=Colletotrichum tanaceti TaxID=1306861 RepID=A0A4U6X5S1_9PEZI|nr:hypothetical protein CTA1_8609 [Colletotrichum tanaceti]